MEYTLVGTTLSDGTRIEFDLFQFRAAVMKAKMPSTDGVEQHAEMVDKMAAVIADVIPALKDRSDTFRAGIGFRITEWMEQQGKASGQ